MHLTIHLVAAVVAIVLGLYAFVLALTVETQRPNLTSPQFWFLAALWVVGLAYLLAS